MNSDGYIYENRNILPSNKLHTNCTTYFGVKTIMYYDVYTYAAEKI